MAEPAPAHEEAPSPHLSDDETEDVAENKATSARVVHEAVRLQGLEEMKRPAMSLLLSAFAAGLAITASVLAEAFLILALPAGPAFEPVTSLGYTLGYLVVILGGLQLFTENTVTAVLPVATDPGRRNVIRLLRLWGLVLAGNLLGTLLAAGLIAAQAIVSPDQRAAVLELSRPLLDHDARTTLMLGIPAGFLVGSIAWIIPNARESAFWVIVAITWLVGLGGFSHVVAGSTEAWLLWLTGEASLGWAVFGFIAPALAGNVIGGTGLFALLAHGQVRGEI